MKNKWLAILVLITIAGIVSGYSDLTCEDVHDRLVQADTLLLLDVREVTEYRFGHIAEPDGQLPITPVNMPYRSDILESQYTRLPRDRDIIVYCLSGGRSAAAASFLESKGFSRIFNMLGGFSSWTHESRNNGFGDHSGQWLHRTDTKAAILTCPVGTDTSRITFPPGSIPDTDDSIYVELHFASAYDHPVTDAPDSELGGLYRLTMLDPFGLTLFDGDSLILGDSIALSLFPEYQNNKDTFTQADHEMTVRIPEDGWRSAAHAFENHAFQRNTPIPHKWYHCALHTQTAVASRAAVTRKPAIHIFPNPFNGSVHIDAPANATIFVFDIRGRLIERIHNNRWIPDASLGSGVYLIRMRYANTGTTRKITYIR